MEWRTGIRAPSVPRGFRAAVLLPAICALALAGCSIEALPDASVAQPRGASVAFDTIDGPPPAQFRKLVQNLNSEAQSRRLAVMSRESPSAYRVRGYIAAKEAGGRTTISWVWDVFDRDQHRALRIDGEETVKGKHRDAWAAADDAMLNRIARSSMTQLAAFLTSPEVAPGTAQASGEPQLVLAATHDSSPEAAGIFRIFQAHADPAPQAVEAAPVEAGQPIAGPIPLPRRRPPPDASVSARDMLTLAASSR